MLRSAKPKDVLHSTKSAVKKFESAKNLRREAKYNKMEKVRSTAPPPTNDVDNEELKKELMDEDPFIFMTVIDMNQDNESTMNYPATEPEENKQECSCSCCIKALRQRVKDLEPLVRKQSSFSFGSGLGETQFK